MQLTRYDFKDAVNAFFEMPTEVARKLLPDHLEPLEVHHGSGIFAITAFNFTGSMVGNYHEIVLAVVVPPLVQQGGVFPQSAFYPFIVGTSTEESRQHAIERWHLPHYMKNIEVDFDEDHGQVKVTVREGDALILEFTASDHDWSQVDHLYQAFMVDGSARYKVDMHLQGVFSEHEEETGSLRFYDHPMLEGLDTDEITTYPFRELWMKDGRQLFEELETI